MQTKTLKQIRVDIAYGWNGNKKPTDRLQLFFDPSDDIEQFLLDVKANLEEEIIDFLSSEEEKEYGSDDNVGPVPGTEAAVA